MHWHGRRRPVTRSSRNSVLIGWQTRCHYDRKSLPPGVPARQEAIVSVMLEHGQTPVAAVIAVVLRGDTMILVRRANPPDAGLWGFPGGKIEFGEPTEQAAVRELREETGVVAHATETFTALDALETAADGAVMRHFVLIAVLCRWLSGEPVAGDDAMEARWFTFDELSSSGIQTSLAVDEVAEKARQVRDRALHPCVSLRDVAG